MLARRCVLAHKESLGHLARCPHGCFHLQIGRTSLALNEDEYIELVAMINQSASNYELPRAGEFPGGALAQGKDIQ